MSAKERRTQKWAAFVGDFSILKEFLAEKTAPQWMVVRFIDAFLRGFSQVVLANNPISGLLILIAIATGSPGALAFCSVTSFLGLIISMMIREPPQNVENGHPVVNPFLVGAVSYALIPKLYGAFDAFSLLLVLLGTIFSVYLARSLGSGKFPCIVWPFNLTELAILLALSTQTTFPDEQATLRLQISDNATSEATAEASSSIVENVTNSIDWGLVLRGIVTSSSQVFAMNNVASGAIIYLAMLIYSPITTGFAFLGALIGTFSGLELGASVEEVSSGFWGFNSLLTAAALGGTFFVLNGQTAAATLVATVYTTIVQYAVVILFQKIGLPILTVPFILVASLFVRLRGSPDGVFPLPVVATFPDKQRHDYLVRRRSQRACDVEDPELNDKRAAEPVSD